MNKKVSIIIPIYNSEKYLKRCINSVLNQTYKNYELILINDGSSDNSKKICLSYLKLHNNIIFIDSVNKGVSEARNKGINIASGDYIMFIDSDDYIASNTLEVMVSNLKSNIEIVFGKIIKVTKKGLIYSNYDYNSKLFDKGKVDLFKKSILGFTISDEKINFPYNEGPYVKLYKSEIIKNNNILFNKDIILGEDGLFNYQVYDLCENILFINMDIYYYCDNDESAMTKLNKKKVDSYFKLFDIYNDLITKDWNKNFNIFIIRQIHRIFKNYIYTLNKKDSIKEFEEMLKNKYVKRVINDNLTGYNKKHKLILLILKTENYYLIKLFYFFLKFV